MTEAARVWRLSGGPQHGTVIEDAKVSTTAVSYRVVLLLGDTRAENFLDEIAGELRWNPNVEWYERSRDGADA